MIAAATVGVSLTTGCVSDVFDSRSPSPDLSITNRTDTKLTVNINIRHIKSDKEVFTTTITLSKDEQKDYLDILQEGGEYEITIEADGMKDTYRWDERNEDISPEDDGLIVYIEKDKFVFTPYE